MRSEKKRWLYLLVTVIAFIIFIVILFFFFLLPSNRALAAADRELDRTDNLLRRACRTITQEKISAIEISPQSIEFCREVLRPR